MKILVACEESQRVCIAFREKGHEAFSCDLVKESGHHPEYHIQEDALFLLKKDLTFITNDGTPHYVDKWDMLIAFPPCTDLCVTGNRWFANGYKSFDLRIAAANFFMKFAEFDCEKIAIENPVGIMSTIFRKPDQIIHPYLFGDPVKKRTCLWLKGLPKLTPTNDVRDNVKIHVMKDGKKIDAWYYDLWNKPKIRAEMRSKTFPGIAKAMAEQWG